MIATAAHAEAYPGLIAADDASALICSTLLVHPERIRDSIDALPVESMPEPWRRIAQEAIRYIRRGEEISMPHLIEKVRRTTYYSAEDSRKWIDDLVGLDYSSTPATVRAAVADLRERASKDAIQTRLRRLAGDMTSSADELVAEAREAIENHQPLTQDESDTLADTLVTDPADETTEVIRTGIARFDGAMPNGGLSRGEIIGMAAPPGGFKTLTTIGLTLGALETNPDLHAVFGLGEMTRQQVRNRALSCISGLSIGILRRDWADLTDDQEQRKRDGMEALRDIGQRLHFVRPPLTPSAIEARIIKTGAMWCVIDYLQLCASDRGHDSRRDAIDEIVRELVRISNQHGVAMIVLSNMPKNTGHARRDIYSAFKESSEIAHAVDIALVGERLGDEDAEPLPGRMPPAEADVRWRMLKCRHGACQDILLRYDLPAQRFRGIGP